MASYFLKYRGSLIKMLLFTSSKSESGKKVMLRECQMSSSSSANNFRLLELSLTSYRISLVLIHIFGNGLANGHKFFRFFDNICLHQQATNGEHSE